MNTIESRQDRWRARATAQLGVATAVVLCASWLPAQPAPRSPDPTNAGAYASHINVVRDAQQQVLEQAREMLNDVENLQDRAALESAIKEMERAQTALNRATRSPETLSEALSAQQVAYRALLKVMPREYNVSRSRNRSGNSSSSSPNQRQLDQLQMSAEENRYETERQALSAPTQQQREQLQTANRLKELAQRQQDLNERLRELQTALQAARTEQERERVQRELKRLREEEREMIARMDELQQQLERSPNANATSELRQQLEQARSDMQRAAEAMENNAPSQALASGARAQHGMESARDELRRQSSSEFSEQMRQLRTQARALGQQQEEIARQLDELENSRHRSLDNSARTQGLSEDLARQQESLTNLLAGMRAVTEQAENTEPVLSRQLYDALRRAEQMRVNQLLDMSSQLTRRGFLSQATEVERSARQHIAELRNRVEQAAESVLGSEAEALRFAEQELEDLTREVERELASGSTNAVPPQLGVLPGSGRTNAGAAAEIAANGGTNRPSMDSLQGRNGNAEDRSLSAGSQPSPDSGRQGEVASPSPGRTEDENVQRESQASGAANPEDGERERLRQIAERLGNSGEGRGRPRGGPITGGSYVDWADRLRDVESALEPDDLRNQLASVRERMGEFRAGYRERGHIPNSQVLQDQILAPMTQVRHWLQQELARRENARTLVPLDRDPVPENYSELVRRYYERLGSAQ